MKNSNQKNGKIIEFPQKNSDEASNNVVTFPRGEMVSRNEEASSQQWSFRSLKLPVLIGALAVFSLVGNEINFGSVNEMSESRSLASLSSSAVLPRDNDFEKELAKELSSSKQRRPASLGVAPTEVDDFRFGFLASKYAVTLFDGKIQEVSFSNSLDNSEPTYISNRTEFLENHRGIFPVQYQSTKSQSREPSGEKVFESYALLDGNQSKVGQIFFELDVYGRLLAMKVESTQ